MSRAQRASFLDRALRPFADVRAGEGVTALLLAANVFLILAAYYTIKPLRDGLVIAEEGAETMVYLHAATVVALGFVVPAYGWLADKVPRKTLINVVTWIFAGALVVFYLLGVGGAPLGIPFFVFGSMFAVMIVAQFWSFANDIYQREEGERLFPIVAFGASLGGVIGVTVVGEVIEDAGVYLPMLIAAAILLAEVQITNYVDRRERTARESHLPDVHTTATVSATGSFRAPRNLEELEEAAERERKEYDARERGEEVEEDEQQASGKNAFSLVAATPYLLLICFLIFFLNWVNTNGQYILGRVVEEATAAAGSEAAQERAISAFYADFYRNQNILALLIQLFVVSRVIKYVGIRWAIMILPTLAMGVYATIAFFPVIAVVKWAKIAENATDYSLNNTVRHALFLPTTREQKYKGKQVSDSWFHRAGDVFASLTVFVGAGLLSISTAAFAITNLGLAVVFLGMAFWIGRSYKRLVEEGRPPRVRPKPVLPVPGAAPQRGA